MKEYTLRDIIYAIAGELYALAPRNEVRDVDKIMIKARHSIIEKSTNPIGDLYLISFGNRQELYSFIENAMQSDEFKNLNLSYNELQQGILVDDPSRAPYKFTSAYDVVTSESWKDDFIDLTAFVQNVTHKLWD